MFDNLSGVAKGIQAQLVDVYWGLLPLVVVILIILEFFKDPGQNPNVPRILKRAIVSVLLLYSLDLFVNMVGEVSNLIIERINGGKSQWEILKSLGPDPGDGAEEWFSVKSNILYAVSLVSYLIAYLGFFVAEAMTNLVWVVLYSIAPLMVLAHVPQATSNVTKNLYMGFVKVVVWGLLWQILGRLLLALAVNVDTTGMDDYLMQIVLNLSIGIAMLFIPIFTRSLVNDGLESAAGAMALAPAYTALKTVKTVSKTAARKTIQGTKNAAGFAARPALNPLRARINGAKSRIDEGIQRSPWKDPNGRIPRMKKASPKVAERNSEPMVKSFTVGEDTKRRQVYAAKINANRQKGKNESKK